MSVTFQLSAARVRVAVIAVADVASPLTAYGIAVAGEVHV